MFFSTDCKSNAGKPKKKYFKNEEKRKENE
jgi:hypothetical protein